MFPFHTNELKHHLCRVDEDHQYEVNNNTLDIHGGNQFLQQCFYHRGYQYSQSGGQQCNCDIYARKLPALN